MNRLLPMVFALMAAAVWGSLPCRAEDNIEALLKQKQGVEHRLARMTVQGESVPLPANPAITLTLLVPDIVGGHAGVNRYFGGYQLASGGRLYWSKPGFAVTRMAGPPELMALENAFLNALGSTDFVQPLGPFLIYEKQDGTTRLEFEVLQPEAAMRQVLGQEMLPTLLVVDGLEILLPPEARVTLTLGENNRAHGVAAINLYSGSFQLGDEDRVWFDPRFVATLMGGPPELMQLEARYLEALPRATRLRVRSGEVILENDDKTVLLGFRIVPRVLPAN